MEVTAFSAAIRAEFMRGKLEADSRPFPADYDLFTTRFPSTTKVENHTFMSNLPRLAEFKGYTPFTKLVNKEYSIANKEYRTGISVRKTDIDDDQVGGYMLSAKGLPERASRDVGHFVLAHLAAGTTNTCFDGTAFFANSHTIGTGDNLDTYDAASNDGVTHKIVALRTDNSVIKPVIFQDREAVSALQTDAGTEAAALVKEYQYWVDTRFGLGYGYWWDACHMTITDTPTVAECYSIVEQIINLMRTYTLPKGRDSDDSLYIHEGWKPAPSNFVLACNLKLGVILERALKITQYVAATGNVDNVYQNIATVLPTSALGA